MIELIACLLIAVGLLFFVMGSYGLIRLEDDFCCLHALSKVDNLALGFVLLGVGLLQQSLWLGLQLLVIWLFCLVASAASGYLFASKFAREAS